MWWKIIRKSFNPMKKKEIKKNLNYLKIAQMCI